MADVLRDGGEFRDPVIIYRDAAGVRWLADGFYRLAAAKLVGRSTIDADERSGEFRDALLCSLKANATHGSRRTAADVRKAISVMLLDAEWVKLSDREIGRHVGCHGETVGAVRRTMVDGAEIRHVETRTDSTGRQQPATKPRKPAPVDPPPGLASLADLPEMPPVGTNPPEPPHVSRLDAEHEDESPAVELVAPFQRIDS